MAALVMQNVALGKGGVRKLRGQHSFVIPAKAGTQSDGSSLGSRFRGNDEVSF
jgi:hypothetical protein